MIEPVEGESPLVGRVPETSALRHAFDAARAGRPGLILVEGPAGIGKTALVRQALPADARTLRVAGVAWEASRELGLAQQIACIDGGAVEERRASSVALMAEHLHRQWSAHPGPEPLVVLVDDAHWADAGSLRAIRSAVRHLENAPVVVVLLARDDAPEPDGWAEARRPLDTAELLDGCRDESVVPRPLSAEETAALSAAAHGPEFDMPVARRLRDHTLGNPGHILRLLAELPATTWRDPQAELPAPARLTARIEERLAACSGPARALLHACAVLGAVSPLEQAAALAGLDDPLAAAEEARATGLLTSSVAPGRNSLAFPHPLTRAAVRTTVPLPQRAALHTRAAGLAPDPGSRLAHRIAASPTADASLAAELERYADERAAAGEWSAVADTLVTASRLSPDRTTRQDLLLRAVDAFIGAGDIPQADAYAPELESFPVTALRDTVLGYLAVMRGRASEAEAFLHRAEQLCEAESDRALMARISQRRVLHALGRCDAPALVTWARRAIALAEAPRDPSAVESEAVLGLGLAWLGRAGEAATVYSEAAAKVSGGAQPQRFQLGRGWADLALDAPEVALHRLEAAASTDFRLGSTRISLWAQGWLARTQFVMGAWDEAEATVERAAARVTEARITYVRPVIHWTGAQLHALRGNWETAEHHVRAAAADAHHYEVMFLPARLARAYVAEARADYTGVVEALTPVARIADSAQAVAEPGFWPWPGLLANALVMLGRLDEADELLHPHERRAADRGHRSARAALAVGRGRLTAARGDIDTARSQFEEALTLLDGLPLPFDRTRLYYAYGQTLRRAGRRRQAAEVLTRAREGYALLGAHTYVARCDRELNAGRKTSDTDSGLTPQEQAVVRLVAAGATNKQAAGELFLSEKTVQYHLTHVYTKLGLRNRAELAALHREGGIDPR
ncbi:AAA family ATPase [Streptomyces sp. NPDC055955]|uniref:helix-turn-helix transcriptional regulator n=1 Tax=Streptomyces sp. NPDC055955 TaxID=3345665 RepID=UPI0035DBFE6E